MKKIVDYVVQRVSSVTFFAIFSFFVFLCAYLFYWAARGYFQYGLIIGAGSFFQFSHAALLIYSLALLLVFLGWISKAGLNLSKEKSAKGIGMMVIAFFLFWLELMLFQLQTTGVSLPN